MLFLDLVPLYPDEQRLMCLKLGIRENLDYTWNIPEGEAKEYMHYVAGFIYSARDIAKCALTTRLDVSFLKLIENRGKQNV